MGRGILDQGEDYIYYSKYCPSLYKNTADQVQIEFEKNKITEEINTVYRWLFIYSLFGILSMVSSILVAGTIFKVKKLQQHPNMLIAYLSIANFMSCWSLLIYIIGVPDFVCYFGLADLLHYWLNSIWKFTPFAIFGSFKSFELIDAIKTLCFTNLLIFDAFQIAAISLSGFTCLDLYLSFKNPFQQGKYRMKWYLIGTLLIVLLVGPNMRSMVMNPNDMFDTYILPYFYLDPSFQKDFKQADNATETSSAELSRAELQDLGFANFMELPDLGDETSLEGSSGTPSLSDDIL